MDRLKSLGVGLRSPNDPFFDDGNALCRIYTKKCIVDEDDETFCHKQIEQFLCQVPNCDLEFDSLLNYELHYNSCHRFTCAECRKHLPSPHLLDLHVSEVHDSYFKAKSERVPMYKCFVETCIQLFQRPKDRKDHCIRDHNYPHDFRFDLVMKKPMSKPKKVFKKKSAKKMEVEPPSEESKPIKGFEFSSRRGRKTFAPQKSKPLDNMGELMESLPSS